MYVFHCLVSCEELVVKCSHGIMTTDGHECCQTLRPVATTSGLCFSRLSERQYFQTMAGEYRGFVLYLSLPQDDVPGTVCATAPNLGNGVLFSSHCNLSENSTA